MSQKDEMKDLRKIPLFPSCPLIKCFLPSAKISRGEFNKSCLKRLILVIVSATQNVKIGMSSRLYVRLPLTYSTTCRKSNNNVLGLFNSEIFVNLIKQRSMASINRQPVTRPAIQVEEVCNKYGPCARE